jgi:hypothetical protein
MNYFIFPTQTISHGTGGTCLTTAILPILFAGVPEHGQKALFRLKKFNKTRYHDTDSSHFEFKVVTDTGYK